MLKLPLLQDWRTNGWIILTCNPITKVQTLYRDCWIHEDSSTGDKLVFSNLNGKKTIPMSEVVFRIRDFNDYYLGDRKLIEHGVVKHSKELFLAAKEIKSNL